MDEEYGCDEWTDLDVIQDTGVIHLVEINFMEYKQLPRKEMSIGCEDRDHVWLRM